MYPSTSCAGKYRRYNYASLRDLLRVIRNKHSHFRELPLDLQERLGPLPHGFLAYFEERCEEERGWIVVEGLRMSEEEERKEVGLHKSEMVGIVAPAHPAAATSELGAHS